MAELHEPGTAHERVTWLGHATVLIETGGARLLTDPVLRPRVAHLRRHPPMSPVPEHLDAVLVSHLHHDHLDLPTVRALDPAAPLVVPAGAGRTRAVRSVRRTVLEVRSGEAISIAGVRVRAVPAVHDGRRTPLDPDVSPIGFVVEGGRRVYFAGDTEVFDGMRELGDHLDLALLPVWGWGPRLGPGHMDPEQAARAAALLRPAVAVPIHWGTLLPLGTARRHGRLLRVPGEAFAARVRELAPEVRVAVLAPGETLEL